MQSTCWLSQRSGHAWQWKAGNSWQCSKHQIRELNHFEESWRRQSVPHWCNEWQGWHHIERVSIWEAYFWGQHGLFEMIYPFSLMIAARPNLGKLSSVSEIREQSQIVQLTCADRSWAKHLELSIVNSYCIIRCQAERTKIYLQYIEVPLWQNCIKQHIGH